MTYSILFNILKVDCDSLANFGQLQSIILVSFGLLYVILKLQVLNGTKQYLYPYLTLYARNSPVSSSDHEE